MILNSAGRPLHRAPGFVTTFSTERTGPSERLESAIGWQVPSETTEAEESLSEAARRARERGHVGRPSE